MKKSAVTDRRSFVTGCLCVGCAGALEAATPSNRNAKPLKAAENEHTQGLSKLTPDKSDQYDIAYCGIYCAACKGRLEGVAKTGKKCKCCTNPAMKSKCAVFNCARAKKVANCGLCPDFESCEILKNHHAKALYRQVARTTCLKIRERGIEAVRAELHQRWSCPACGKIFAWQSKEKCPHCGNPIQELGEKDLVL
jgi:hypothetical protein